jgi:LuxR family maltose regulon positive regulatory protein
MSLQAHLALCENRMNRGIKLARDALEYLDEADFFFRNLTLNVLGQILETKGDVASAAEVYRQGFNSGIQSEERLGSMVVFTNLVFSLNELGQRKEGLALCQKVDSDIGGEIVGGRPLSDGVALSWSLISYEADQLVIARQQAQRALDSLTQYGISQGISWAQYILALVHLAYSEWDDMLRLTREGFQHASRTGTGEIHGSWFKALEAQASLQRGDLDAAAQWAESKGYTSQDKPHHWVERSYFTYVRILLMHNHIQDARQLLKTMETSAQKGSRLRKLITIDLLMALTDLAQDDRGSALQHLESALVYASHQDYKRAFLDEGQAILDLLPDVRHLAPQFVDDLLAITLADISPPLSADQPYEPLSERELEVLRLVSRGLSNRQIAEALFITLGTVKKHLNNIFGKLQVQNRTQAVARSRELNLLD